MALKDYYFDGSKKLNLSKLPTGCKQDQVDKADIIKRTEKNIQQIGELQDKLYAEGKEGLIIVLQAMDAAGKDSTIKHVMNGINPQGVDVYSFKQPSSEELAHDFLWRAMTKIPQRGKIAIFNRSYYEDVLVVKVHNLQENYKMASRCIDDKDFFQKRYQQINHYEEYLYENSYRVIKIFLNVSNEKQEERFLERIDTPAKNWKFSDSDLKERKLWPKYMKAFTEAVNATASKHAPWYVLPADQKWYTRYLVSEAMLAALNDMDPHYPALSKEAIEKLAACKEELLSGKAVKENIINKDK